MSEHVQHKLFYREWTAFNPVPFSASVRGLSKGVDSELEVFEMEDFALGLEDEVFNFLMFNPELTRLKTWRKK